MQSREIKKLDELMNGAVTERFHDALQEVLANIFDPNTDPVKVRGLTLSIKLKPTKSRDAAAMTMDIKTTIAPPVPVENTIFIGCDDNGVVSAWEKSNQVPGQVSLSGEVYTPNVVKFEKAE